ncbi:unnamed protein product [Pseudo-nitzschia multistriata]|uniref:Uncharacterized protein n=1 Tax=Pseudo-nitzschia multistriata TaxID=183589 RepID=A0A448Z1W4_9STRA|nr:unnamed protein product [Pseudo-nitzschia multistriata]
MAFYIIRFRALLVLASILLSVSSFQRSHHVSSLPSTTKHGGKKTTNHNSQTEPFYVTKSRTQVSIGNRNGERGVSVFLSNNSDNARKEGNGSYNDDAFGFIFLGGFAVTQDPFFAGTFVLFSAIAAVATRNGTLPSSRAVPAAVAGFTLIASLLLPTDQLYSLFALERPELSLPADVSVIKAGFCTVSMLYGFLLSSTEQNENTSP